MRSERLNVVLNVTDFDRSMHFYRDLLGFPVISSWDGDDGPGAILSAGEGRTVELFGPPYGARNDRRTVAGVELAFDVPDAADLMADLETRGVPITRGLRDNPWGDRSFGIDDPDGVRIWMVEITDPGHFTRVPA